MSYDQAYFDGGVGYSQYDFSEQYNIWADEIIAKYNPTSVLDIGAAKGFLVKALRDKGVKAYGLDVSEYALDNAIPEVTNYLFLHDITSPRELEIPKVDLIVSTDTFEHIPEDKLELVKMFMLQHGDRYFIRVATPDTPNWEHDPTHITIKPLTYWIEFWEDADWQESK